MVQANQFHGLPSEDANTCLQHFLELYNTIVTLLEIYTSMTISFHH